MKKSNSVEVFFFGQLKIVTPYGEITEEKFKSDKITKLLSYLILNRASVVSVEVLSSVIWPQGVDEPYASLRTLVFRARKNLADIFPERDFIVANSGSYRVNGYYNLIVDSDYLSERKKLSLKADDENNMLMKDIEFISKASQPFLETLASDAWGLPVTTYYNSELLSLITDVATQLYNKNSFNQSREIAAKGLLIDPLAEKLHIITIDSLLEQGFRKMALMHYNNAVDLFRNEYCLNPSKEFLSVFSRITN